MKFILPQQNMLKSLLSRLTSVDFKPAQRLSTEQLEKLFH